MTSCIFRYCKNTKKNVNESGISFHRFVNPGHPKREQWIKIVQKDRSEDTWLPTTYSYICSAHFRDEDIYKTKAGKHFLKKSAIPYSKLPVKTEDPLASPTSLNEVDVSDSESIFDTAREIELKNVIKKVTASKRALSKKCIKLQRQNRYLQRKNLVLTVIVQQLKQQLRENKNNE